MKKILLVLLSLISVITIAGCEGINISPRTYEIAMITDAGEIDDKSFNQGTWEGIVEFAEAKKLTHKYYKPAEVSDTAYVEAIDLAVSGGAKVIVTPGFLFEPAIYTAQTKYPNVKFILIDGVPHPGDYTTFNVADNTISILFKEQESGFLAGYAAVMEGFRELGFMGGIAVPAVVRFGLGFVAGAYYAAVELGLDDFEFNMDYYDYLGTFAPGDEVKTQAAAWFANGVEVIHVAAGGAGNSVMAAAAEETDKWVIGVDIDQASQSPTVISSAMKALGVVVKQALQDYLDDTFVGGQTLILGATEDAVGLPAGQSFRFKNFLFADYITILDKLADGTIVLPMDDAGLTTYIEELIDSLGSEDPVDPEVTTLANLNFGTGTVFGYGEGALIWTEDGNSYTIDKNRVQINVSTFEIRAEMGAFLVFAPIQGAENAYILIPEIEIIDAEAKPIVFSFDHITWHSTNGPTNIATLTVAEFRLEKFDSVAQTWSVVDSVNLKDIVDGVNIVNTELETMSAGIYRVAYYIEGATSTTNTFYAMIVDNLKITR
jgi:basic membrane protein A